MPSSPARRRRRRARVVVALVLVLGVPGLTLGPPAYAADPGLPDTAFDDDGLWEKTVIDAASGVAGLTVDSAGRVVLFGPSGVRPEETKSELLRLEADGDPDTTFDLDGSLPFDATVAAGSFEWPRALTTDATGRYVTLTAMYNGSAYGFQVRRYTDAPALSLVVTSTLSALEPNLPRDIATDTSPDQNIIVVGSSNIDPSMIATRVRGGATSPGTPDPAFGVGGSASINPEGSSHDSVAHAVELDASGRILLGGTSYSQPGEGSFSGRWALVRLTPNGAPDPTFSGDGIVLVDPPTGFGALLDLAVDSQGRILAAGSSQPCGVIPTPDTCSPEVRPRLARFLPTGALDVSFGRGGWATLPASLTGRTGTFQAVAVDPRGWILAGGSSGLDGSVVRFTPQGRPDLTFATGGVFLLDPYPSGGSSAPRAGTNRLAIRGNRVIAAGYAREFAGHHWAAQRLDHTGNPAPSGRIGRPKPSPSRLTGTAGPGGLVARVHVAVQKVDAALLRDRHQCRWATGSRPRFVTARAVRKRGQWTCVPPAARWRRASGTTSWRLTWDRALASGPYQAFLRVSLDSGRVKVVDTRGFRAR